MPRDGWIDRRTMIASLLASGMAGAMAANRGFAASNSLITKTIPSSGEVVPPVGLGSWITFNVGNDREALETCADVVRAFFANGGRMIDSSPMYGSSQNAIGYALDKLDMPGTRFAADKVWTSSGNEGPEQIEQSRQKWGVANFDLVQVHNLVAWEDHLRTLLVMKSQGKIRYVGVTTSHGRRHRALERIMQSQPLDFVQLTYNMTQREAERRILPLAQDRGIAVICNRPFGGGRLINRAKREPLPPWATEAGAANWAEFLLKYLISHPAVTCAIPATTRVDHVRENMAACRGALPDHRLRVRMRDHIEAM